MSLFYKRIAAPQLRRNLSYLIQSIELTISVEMLRYAQYDVLLVSCPHPPSLIPCSLNHGGVAPLGKAAQALEGAVDFGRFFGLHVAINYFISRV